MRRRPTVNRSTVLLLAVGLTLPLLGGATASAAGDGYPVRRGVAATGEPTPEVRLLGSGFGHSVGMSQYGAYGLARQGWDADRILDHYYPGTTTGTWDGSRTVVARLTANAITTTPVRAVDGELRWRIGTEPSAPLPPGSTVPGPTPPPTEPTTGQQNGAEQPAPGALVQPAGSTWTVRWQGDPARPQRTELVDAAGTVRATTDQGLWVDLTDPAAAAPQPSATRLETHHPTRGTSQYAYGSTEFRTVPQQGGDTGRLRISQHLPLEGYVRGIAEVPGGWGSEANRGMEALKAQAIAARTFMLRSGTGGVTPAFQVYVGWPKEAEGPHWRAAVDATALQVRRAGSALASTYYSSSHGGSSEPSQFSWAFGGEVDHLVARDDRASAMPENRLRSWDATVSHSAARTVLAPDLTRITRLRILDRTPGGTPRTIEVHGPEGVREYRVTAAGGRQPAPCGASRRDVAGANLLCDLRGTVRNAEGEVTTVSGVNPAGTRLPSQQVQRIGFSPFLDDLGSAHEYATVWTHRAGIAEGTSATTFDPAAPVTRAQMASFLYRAFDLPAATEHAFDDVPPGSTHAAAINALAAADVARGTSATTFDPGGHVTRAQMASFLARAAGWDTSTSTTRFTDVADGSTHAGPIAAIDRRGVTTGCGDARYCPTEPVARGQMASFLHRLVRP
jgi:SpoIID/LytB domain protein